FLPDIISTDLHQRNVYGPVFDLPHCMNKFLDLGMSPVDAIRATTTAPASAIGLADVSLRPGQPADVALFELQTGSFPLFDSSVDVRFGTQALVNKLTLVGGRPLPPKQLPPSSPWIELTESQQAFVASRDDRLRAAAAFAIERPDELA